MRSRAADLAGGECWTAEDVIRNEAQSVIDELVSVTLSRSGLRSTASIASAFLREISKPPNSPHRPSLPHHHPSPPCPHTVKHIVLDEKQRYTN